MAFIHYFYPLARFFETKWGIIENTASVRFTYENSREIASEKLSADPPASLARRGSTTEPHCDFALIEAGDSQSRV